MVLKVVVALVCAYLLGSIPTAYLVCKFRNKADIREIGSHNMGAMNTFYQVGFGWGMLVLLTDIFKGVAAMAIAESLGLTTATYLGVSGLFYLLAGIVAVLGHDYPVWLKFKGGKGGATAIGVLVYLMQPWSIPMYGGLFLLIFLVTRAPTISYGAAFIGFPFLAGFVFQRNDWIVFWAILIAIPIIKYIPRLKEMRATAGSWSRVIKRKSVKERF
ncbi:MAG TPA: glycerol-3-phosphate acyltransferase [Dehalococcoidales bacterium]|nr:glycerol-3-phosphate acyltransferase [Dehalococcoidales bacterium]